jgi:GTP-binding protein
MSKPPPSVVLVGRPNVGKSTLFNRLTRSRRAIVTPVPGTTRDLITNIEDWGGFRIQLTDKGGMFGASEDPLHALVLERGRQGIRTADLLVLVVDGREGLVAGDQEIAEAVRAANRPVIVAINKTDDRRAQAGVIDFYELGFDPVLEISAEHGTGIGELIEAIGAGLPRAAQAPSAEPPEDAGGDQAVAPATAPEPPQDVTVAVVGRPNAGKSSLVNRLLREERMMVSEMPGTTRDAVESVLTWHRRAFRIVDTAGIRRPGRVASSGQVESVSVLLARRAIEGADVVVLIIDASAGVTDQDAAIAGEAHKAGRGVVLVANKWDLMKGRGSDFVNTFDEDLRRQLKFLDYAPVLHVSAATGERVSKVLETIDQVAAARRTRVKTHALNTLIERASREHPPVSPGKRHVRILYAAQIGIAPPTFACFTNVATSFHFSYMRYLENRIRQEFGFVGTPIRITVRARRERTEPEADRPRRPTRKASRAGPGQHGPSRRTRTAKAGTNSKD